ncbi:hypothetical protein [Bacteroides graminisolvens]|uniref:hypothetical protein n=1 Tax=Bacteroides graminisolvens TaxID=477666 RepID=UPI0029C9A804|nr:hypothetical protein [Bacteroides graminisolvens]
MNSHTDFILSPMTRILEDVVTAIAGIGNGIETYPIYDYVMQTLFLKMTGFQEQKMKCVCWELATYDYEYRYEKYSKKTIGECSNYNDKKDIYKDLIKQIQKSVANFDVSTYLDREEILRETFTFLKDTFGKTNLSVWAQNSFIEFVNDRTLIRPTYFGSNDNLFENTLQNLYKQLYSHRNRCAHNTLSYQQNLPTLKTLVHDDYKHDNYFVRFSLLILIDKIFIRLYNKYLEENENRLYR